MAIKFILQETLDKLEISRNKIHRKGDVRLATLYEMANNQSKQIKLDTLNSIIKTINDELPKDQKINVSDILIYVEDDENGVDEK